ncbi:MAG: TerC family protein [Micromonosporaceae bacterium]|nr:TerC family protein [Micromonosporaceae bacterium]
MGVGTQVWVVTLIGLVGVLLIDLLIIGRKPHEPSPTESAIWVSVYVTLAVFFGVGIWFFTDGAYAGQFFAGWLTEYSLSVDNLFVFVIIMARFAVPRHLQQKVLMIGIVMALVMRGIFIAAGAALISRFDWIFFIFGAFLLYTAIKMARHGTEDESELKENSFIKVARRWLRTSPDYDEKGHFITTLPDGRRILTPLIIVIIAIGTTDLIFALDSIPAIFGLTHEAYIVFTANVFALMGLRQLYFLLGGLLDRLKYLSHGLAVVLGFIGVKLILEALAGNNLPFINNGEPVAWAPHVPIWFSLGFIGVALAITTVASLISTRNDRIRAAEAARRQRPPRKRPSSANRRQPTRRR